MPSMRSNDQILHGDQTRCEENRVSQECRCTICQHSAVIANLLLLLVVTEEKVSQLNIVTVAEYITTALSVNQMALL